MEDLIAALRGAIDMERAGYDIYMKAAEATKNILGRFTLDAIGKKELDHITAIQTFMKRLSDKSTDYEKAIAEIRPKEKVDYYRPLMKKLSGELEAKAAPDAALEASYKIAMDLETRSYNLYKKLEGETNNSQAKKFFKFLMGEENTHYEILQETLKYLDDPWEWFKEQEKWIVEG